MNILIVAEKSDLPAVRYGGLQRMAWSLGKALHLLGHGVTFLCKSCNDASFARIIVRNPQIPIEQQIPADVDVVHFNNPVPEGFSRPYLETIHGNFNKPISQNAVFVSQNHAWRFGSKTFVYNGLDWDADDYRLPNLSLKRDRYHFLGKAAWKVKNVDGAIDVIKRLPGPDKLDVLGGVRFNFHMGWRFTITPRVRFHGMCGADVKREVMSRSRGLIFPVCWHEPFGLAVIESLYFGAPVFATPYGAMPEIVTPEVGALSSSVDDMVRQIASASFSPQRCHDYAREVFSARSMALGYLALYEKVLNGETLNETIPSDTHSAPECLWNKR